MFKAYERGDSGWNLPATYAGDPDQKDMYHVGVVTSVCPLVITHCTSVEGGIKRDTALGKWKWAGMLDIVNEEEEPTMERTARVIIPEGKTGTTVNLRKRAETGSPVVTTIKHGTEVKVGEAQNGWYPVTYNGCSGYMMEEFIQVEEPAEPLTEGKMAEARTKVAEAQKKLDEVLALLKGAGA